MHYKCVKIYPSKKGRQERRPTVDIQKFTQGRWDSMYRTFGAHPEGSAWRFRVWAPHAREAALCGDFSGWEPLPMQREEAGTWTILVEDARPYDAYKYLITGADGGLRWKADPFGFHTQTRPENSSKLFDLAGYRWGDKKWRESRRDTRPAEGLVNIYEVHLGSWRINEDGSPYSYRQLAQTLPDYVADMGYNYVELLPVTEYPLDDSWGYQCTGYFAPTSRYGTPHDFMALVDALHRKGIGVILDWVPSHFCKDDYGLIEFDGTCLYEYADPLKWEHAGWGTRVFDFSKGEVVSFLISSAAFWLREYHIDGLRVDAVASMLYLDYDRPAGQWRPNRNGGHENLEAVEFLRRLSEIAFAADPQVLLVAEESTAWPLVTYPPDVGGLGFNLKWNMGWVNDVSHYLKMDPFFRRDHHRDVTFSMVYAFSENFVLPISHDEVVHMKGSLRGKMPGDDAMQLAAVRGFYGYMLCHPGKKLTMMGTELGQWHEWNFAGQLDWYLLEKPAEAKTHDCFRALNRFYRDHTALWANDRSWEGYEWLVVDDNTNNVLVFARRDGRGRELIAAVNFSPVTLRDYRFGVDKAGTYREVFNTEDTRWGGCGIGNPKPLSAEKIPSHGKERSLSVTLPPLGTVIFEKAAAKSGKGEKKP